MRSGLRHGPLGPPRTRVGCERTPRRTVGGPGTPKARVVPIHRSTVTHSFFVLTKKSKPRTPVGLSDDYSRPSPTRLPAPPSVLESFFPVSDQNRTGHRRLLGPRGPRV